MPCEFAKAYDENQWKKEIEAVYGPAANGIIEMEAKAKKKAEKRGVQAEKMNNYAKMNTKTTSLSNAMNQTKAQKEEAYNKAMEKYGVENFGKVKELHEKGIETMRKNGTLPVSKPEENMVNLLIDIYGEENCTPSKRVDWYTLDCELIINDIKIDVEFDGKHWHCESEEQSNKDKIRDGYMKHNNYKVLRFRGSHSAPSREQIVDAINDNNVLPFRVDYIKTIELPENIEDEDVYDIDREMEVEDRLENKSNYTNMVTDIYKAIFKYERSLH